MRGGFAGYDSNKEFFSKGGRKVYPIVWFAIMTALCVAYAERANTQLGPQKRFFIDWSHALSIVLVIILAGVFIAQYDLKEAKEVTPAAWSRAFAAFHAIGISYAIFAGLVLWRKEGWFRSVLALVTMAMSVSYFTWPDQHELSNFVLVMIAVGFSLIGRTATKRGFIVAYVILVLFDIFAVWGSDLMNQIVRNYPGPFPTFLEIGGAGLSNGIGVGDVLFAAIACNHIHQHRGVRRAVFFAAVCTLGILIGLLMISQMPLLLFVSPVAIATLLLPEGLLRID